MLQWATVGDVDVDIGANPSAEEADEGTESTSRKVVDIVDSFRLVVCSIPQLAPLTYPLHSHNQHNGLTGQSVAVGTIRARQEEFHGIH